MNPVRRLRGGPDRAARGSDRRLPGDPGGPRHHHRPGPAARRRLGRAAVPAGIAGGVAVGLLGAVFATHRVSRVEPFEALHQ